MHRQEFTPLDPFNIDATCQGNYRHDSRSLENLTCLWPIDDGHLLLTGAVPDIEHPKPAFNLQIQNVPAILGLSALRLVRNGFAPSTQIGGTLQGSLAYTQSPAENLTGDVTVNGLAIRTPGMPAPIAIPTLHFTSLTTAPTRRRFATTRSAAPAAPASLHLAGASIPLGEDVPLVVSGDFNRQGFSLHFNGNASLERLRPITSSIGLLHNAVAALAPQGSAILDLTVRGPWLQPSSTLGNPAPTATTEGALRLKNAKYQASFLPEPVEIVSAQAALTHAQVIWNPVSVIFHKVPATLSVTAPIPCATAVCVREFSLSTPQLDAAALQSAVMGAGEHGEFLQQILARLDRNKVQWPALNGTVRTATFSLGPLILHDATSSVHIEGRQIRFTSIEAHALNGVLQATGTMSADNNSPHYAFDVQLLHASAAGLTTLWHEPPLSGTVSVNTHVELAGFSTDDLAQSAQGTFHWDWTQGTTTLVPAALTHFDHWSADGAIKNRQLVLDQSQVTRGPLKQTVSGTISFDRKSDLTVTDQEESAHVAKAAQHTQ
jgi:hypothetical protein